MKNLEHFKGLKKMNWN